MLAFHIPLRGWCLASLARLSLVALRETIQLADFPVVVHLLNRVRKVALCAFELAAPLQLEHAKRLL